MLAKPNDWVFYISFFIKNSPAGRDKVRRIFNKLIKFGYIVKSKHRNKKGYFATPEYTVYESPLINNQLKPENPSPVNPPLLNKHLKPNKQVTNNTTTNSDGYIWSSKLSEIHQIAILSLLSALMTRKIFSCCRMNLQDKWII